MGRGRLILHEPYRLFFPLGVLFGLAGTGHWLFYGAQWTSEYSGYFHSSVQAWLYMGSFIAGFLMTAIPRFASARPASALEVGCLLAAMASAFAALSQKAWVAAGCAYLLWLAVLLSFIVRRFASKGHAANPPVEFVWIPVAFAHALAGTAVVVLAYAEKIPVEFLGPARAAAEQGFVLCIVLGVGGFLGPRLMGLFHLPDPAALQKAARDNRQRLYAHLLFAVLMAASFLLEMRHKQAAALLRALVVTLDLAWVSRVLAAPKVKGIFQTYLSLSFWLVTAGVWGSAIFPAHAVTWAHLLFLGGFSLMTFLVATMVVLSHSGQADAVRRPLWIYRVIFFGVLAALAVRLSAQWTPESYFLHLGAASALWMLTAVAWLIFAAPHLLRVPEEGSFERDHERLKRQQADHAC